MSAGFGFIGFGIIGEGTAARMIIEGVCGQSADKPLVIWNRTSSKAIAFAVQSNWKQYQCPRNGKRGHRSVRNNLQHAFDV